MTDRLNERISKDSQMSPAMRLRTAFEIFSDYVSSWDRVLEKKPSLIDFWGPEKCERIRAELIRIAKESRTAEGDRLEELTGKAAELLKGNWGYLNAFAGNDCRCDFCKCHHAVVIEIDFDELCMECEFGTIHLCGECWSGMSDLFEEAESLPRWQEQAGERA